MIFYHHNVQHDINGILTNIFLSSQLLEMSFIEKWKLVAKIWLDILLKYNVATSFVVRITDTNMCFQNNFLLI